MYQTKSLEDFEKFDKSLHDVNIRNNFTRYIYLLGGKDGKEATVTALDSLLHPALGSLFSLKGAREKLSFMKTNACFIIKTTILKRYVNETIKSLEKIMENRLKQYPTKKGGVKYQPKNAQKLISSNY